MRRKHITERFWSKVSISAESECWEWQGAKTSGGYGCILIDGKAKTAHRIAFLLHYHHLPDLDICHSCDNRACCNPHHLWAGTESDNMRDMVEKGRSLHRHGSQNPFSRFTEETVLEIRRLVASGMKQADVGRKFGVSKGQVSKIILRQSWKHI